MIRRRFKIALSLLASCLLFAGLTSVTSAHVLKEDHGVSAVLHIPPDDNPVANQPTELHFSFNSDRGTFSLADCDCQVAVLSNGKLLQKTSLEHSQHEAALEAAATVNFPSIGVYDVVVSGRALDAKFASFSLDYLERVATTADATNPKNNTKAINVLLVCVASFILLAMIAYAALERGGRYAKRQV